VVHVAGTKGKGSVCSMLHHIIHATGRRCGLYTSPHIHHVGERFVIDGRPATTEQLADVVDSLINAVAHVDARSAAEPDFGSLTFFDLCTAAAFQYFHQQQVDMAVIEVGMGGRLDSTNVVQPLVSVITNVSFDHMQQLGNTLAAIAGEKAGIIKPTRLVISGVRQPEARAVVQRLATQHAAPLWELDQELRWTSPDPLRGPCQVTLSAPRTAIDITSPQLRTKLLGKHQRDNLALVYATVVQLRQQGWTISDDALQAGLSAAQPAGRLQIIREHPRVIVDVAHNPASIAALIETLTQLEAADDTAPEATSNPHTARQRTLVFAVSRDKDFSTMLRLVAPYFDRVIMTRFHQNPRATDLTTLAQTWAQVTDPLRPIPCDCVEHPQDAYRLALEQARSQDWVVVAGSLFLLAEIGSWNNPSTDVE
jgi:dihydrofolate synthase/folylpolyglutamate synthase